MACLIWLRVRLGSLCGEQRLGPSDSCARGRAEVKRFSRGGEQMPILNGAVAYRTDLIPQYQQEIDSWEGTKSGKDELECPGNAGKACPKAFRYWLLISTKVSDEHIANYVSKAQKAVRVDCPQGHALKITVTDGPTEGFLAIVHFDDKIVTL